MKYFLGIDLGGTNVKAGVVNEKGEIIGKGNVTTDLPQPAEKIADKMAQSAMQALKEANLTTDDLEWAGVGTPGIANSDTGVVEYSCNLQFYDTPLVKLVKERLHVPVFIENDANAAAYGEFMFGAARGSHKAVAITLGTGVGGGIIIDDKIYSGFNHAGGELGHIVISYGGRPCACGRNGCFEAYASATGLITTTKEAMEVHPESALWKIAPTLHEVNGKTAFDGMRAGDAVATQTVDLYIGHLASGLTSILNIFQPEVCVIGGGICKEGDTLLIPLKAKVDREIYLGRNSVAPDIRIAQLGNDAGIIGAAMLGYAH